MNFRYSPAVTDFAAGVRAFLGDNLTPELRRQMHDTGTIHDPQLHRRMAARGWLQAASSRPGDRRDPYELAALFRELELADAPYHGLSITMIVIGVLEQLGSASLQARVLPELLAGETIAVLGYSEPDSGSDVAAARTRAVAVAGADGDRSWVISGQKMWTTLAHEAGHVLLLTRTDPDAPKHRGLTMFLVPLDAPGITITPVRTIVGERTNAVFYDDVRLPDDCRIGEVNGGWDVMGVALSMERGVMGGTAMIEPLIAAAVCWAQSDTGTDADPAVLEELGRARIDAEVACLLAQHTAWTAAAGRSPASIGNMGKLFASTAYQRAAHAFQELAGASAIVKPEQPGALQAPAGGELERAVRHAVVTTIQGGTTEITRNHIAQHHLGLPRSRGRS